MPKKDKTEKPSPSPAPLQQTDEIIKMDDGSDYRTVAGRKARFNNDFPNGMIIPELVTSPTDKEYFVFKVTVIPDAANKDRFFVGYGQCERIPGNKFASMEKAETTAIGRALSHMSTTLVGAGASEDEIEKAKGATNLQAGIREVVKEETKPTNPKAEPDSSQLEGDELSQYNDWAFQIVQCVTKDALVAMGVKIKEAKLSKRSTEELRKTFNKQLRSFGSEGK